MRLAHKLLEYSRKRRKTDTIFVPIRENSWKKTFLILCVTAVAVRAELTWEATTLARTVHPLQVEDHAEFHFTNTGTNSVEIISFKSTCGCLIPSMSTNQFDAGESGRVDVVFNLRDKMGPQRKGVAVRSSDHPKQPVILYIETNIREAYTLSTKRLEWSLSGDRTSKTCRLINQLETPIKLISANSSSKLFSAELKSIREGFEYEVLVRPVDNAAPGRAVITVQAECPAELPESRTYQFDACAR